MTLPLVLASQSPARLATLRAAGIDPIVRVSNVDEDAVLAEAAVTYPLEWGRDLTAADAVKELARAKAEAVSLALEDEAAMAAAAPTARLESGSGHASLVIGCDSMLELDGEILGKPGTADVAVERWRAMRGRTGVLHTGHWILHTRPHVEAGGGEGLRRSGVGATGSTTVHFAALDDAEIEAYVATKEPLHVAGAFTIDGRGGPFVERIEGDYHNVVGLSLPLVRALLGELGIRITDLWNVDS